MRILVNGLSARLGGGQTYLYNLLRHVPADSKVLLLSAEALDLSGLPGNIEQLKPGVNLENPFRRAWWEYRNLGRLAVTHKADLLFSPGGLLPKGLPPGLKTAVTFQNMLPFDHVQRKRYPLGYRYLRDWLLERNLLSAMRRADLVIFISRFARDFIQKIPGMHDRCVVIPHGVSAAFFRNAAVPAARPAVAPQGEYFLYVSFVDFYKSQIEVVRAFAKVRERTGTAAKLLIAGAEYRPYGDLLRREIDRLGLNDAVRMTGNLPHHDLPGLYQNASINLFASCTENCPNILLEMMASGRPALVSGRGPMPEFGGDTVTYFDPDDVEQLVARWLESLQNPSLAEQRAVLAADRVRSMSWEQVAANTWAAMAGTVNP